MDLATQDLYYQKIDELFYDEDKIVTCPSLVYHLKITLQDAKTLLKTFVDGKRKLSSEFCLTYVISGKLNESKGLAIYLVKEEDLEAKKSLFDIIYSETVFSIQKNKLIDFNAIANINKACAEANPEICLGSVISKNCVKRTIKPNKLPIKQEAASLKDKKSWFQQNGSSSGGSEKTKQTSNSQEVLQEKPTKNNKPGSITNFFSKASVKTNGNANSEIKNNKPKDTSTESKNEPKNADVLKVEPQVANNCSSGVADEKENINDKMEVKENDVEEEKSHDKSTGKKFKKRNTSDKMEVEQNEVEEEKLRDDKYGKKRKKGNKSNAPNKRRKQIQEICDSDSSDIFEAEKDEEDIIEKSDDEPESIVKPQPLTKNKVRKAVDKTHVDDEGFMVTTTEYIYESAPEEEEIEAKKPPPQAIPHMVQNKKNSTTDSENDQKNKKTKSKKNNKNAVTGKQTTLMSFFKKS